MSKNGLILNVFNILKRRKMLKKKRRLNTVQKFWGECVCSDGAFGCSCDILDNDQKTSDYSATFEPLVSLELCQLFRGSCATQFG